MSTTQRRQANLCQVRVQSFSSFAIVEFHKKASPEAARLSSDRGADPSDISLQKRKLLAFDRDSRSLPRISSHEGATSTRKEAFRCKRTILLF
jgi:hypothetical protein